MRLIFIVFFWSWMTLSMSFQPKTRSWSNSSTSSSSGRRETTATRSWVANASRENRLSIPVSARPRYYGSTYAKALFFFIIGTSSSFHYFNDITYTECQKKLLQATLTKIHSIQINQIWRVSSQNALYPFWSIWDIWDLSCWNIKKIIRKFVILLIITSKIFLYIYEQCIIRKVLFCIIRWCPYFKNVKNGA